MMTFVAAPRSLPTLAAHTEARLSVHLTLLEHRGPRWGL